MIIAKEAKLSFEELDMLTIGNVLDYIYTYFNLRSKQDDAANGKPTIRKATQADIDALKI